MRALHSAIILILSFILIPKIAQAATVYPAYVCHRLDARGVCDSWLRADGHATRKRCLRDAVYRERQREAVGYYSPKKLYTTQRPPTAYYRLEDFPQTWGVPGPRPVRRAPGTYIPDTLPGRGWYSGRYWY